MIPPYGRDRQLRRTPEVWLGTWLSRPWWLGLGVILAAAVALIIYFLSVGTQGDYYNNGNCNAQGSGNIVKCTGNGLRAGR